MNVLTGVAISVLAPHGSAISTEANSIQQVTNSLMEFAERSEALSGAKSAAISEVYSLALECSLPDWDGEDALAVSLQTVQMAVDFIRALPNDIPIPELVPEPDGSISFDWIRSRNRVFSLSIGTNDRLAFAWLSGTDKGHGVARFNSRVVPQKILDGVREITDYESTFLRAA